LVDNSSFSDEEKELTNENVRRGVMLSSQQKLVLCASFSISLIFVAAAFAKRSLIQLLLHHFPPTQNSLLKTTTMDAFFVTDFFAPDVPQLDALLMVRCNALLVAVNLRGFS
jgi:hypothetical protein